jgi:hypothetical protein
MAVTLRDVERYLHTRARADRPGTPEEGELCRRRLAEWTSEHPELPEVAARVEAALQGQPGGPADPFAEWFRPPRPEPERSGANWMDRFARGLAGGFAATMRALDDEEGAPLGPSQIEVRIIPLPTREEIVVRARVRRRDARKLRRDLGRRIARELEAWLAAS